MAQYSTYLGGTSMDWTYSGYPLQYGENVLLTMPANSAGTVIMSTSYVWYGEVSATIKTSRDQGVVTAFMYPSPHACVLTLVSFPTSKMRLITSLWVWI